ncbi:phage portal protein family protein [Methylomicrobium album]|uniref:phage portal protein family protein n=1 Tax=Methylomicrobium album TaxID=39775 RepID=UPI00020D8CBC|nr:DUF935 family protein [Methylomicrobium album]
MWREVEEPEDLKARADRDKVIFDMGYKPTLQYVKDTYGGEFEAKPDANAAADDPVALANRLPARPDNAGRKADNPKAQFAEARPLDDPPGEMVALLERAAQPAVDGLMEAVRGVLHSSADLLEVRERLAEIFPAWDKEALAAVFAEAFLAAELAGRGDVNEGR